MFNVVINSYKKIIDIDHNNIMILLHKHQQMCLVLPQHVKQ